MNAVDTVIDDKDEEESDFMAALLSWNGVSLWNLEGQ
jgi:hypothetical protein